MSTPKRIMIIDDEEDLTMMIGYQFKAKGFEVLTASDGVQALERVHDFRPDLIILDINMPRMGGIEFYSKIANELGKPIYPVLVLTARANVKDLFKDLHIDAFMIKPFEIDHLVDESEAIIRRTKHGSQEAVIKTNKSHRKICIAHHDQRTFDELVKIFSNHNFTVIPARDGATAIERISADVPDVALIELGLGDIAGDMVILRLSQMSKTMDVKYVLCKANGAIMSDKQVLDRIAAKTGVFTLIEYNDMKELLVKVEDLYV